MNRNYKYYYEKMMLMLFFVFFSFSFAQDCPEGQVVDCSGDGDCCQEAWIGDGVGDCEDQAFGCDLTCYENDGGDCGPPPTCCDDPSVCDDGDICNDACECEAAPPEEGDDCENAIDYGIINTDTIISGTFTGEPDEDYWVSFTTACEWRDVILSTCGSFAVDTGDGLEYLNTILEVYADSEEGEPACSQFEDWSIEFGQTPNTNWWSDDPEEDDTCDICNDLDQGQCEENSDCEWSDDDMMCEYSGSDNGQETHAVLMIPTSEEQGAPDFDRLQPGTYYARISALPGPNSTGDWQLSLTGRPVVIASASNILDTLDHNPDDGAPGGHLPVTFDASDCTCTEQIVNYDWYWIDEDSLIVGPTSELVESQFMPYGNHSLELIITDLLDIEDTDDFIVNIIELNDPPVADTGEDIVKTIPHDGDPLTINVTIQLSAELSSETDEEDQMFYLWDKISGDEDIMLSDVTAMTPSFNAFNVFESDPKLYEFELTVSDDYNDSDKDTVLVTINAEENLPPIASAAHLTINIEHDGDTLTHNSEIFTLDGSPSSDPNPEDNINYYEWFDSLFVSLELSAFHETFIDSDDINDVLGEHNYMLLVKDVYDAIGDTTIIVTIGPELNFPPDVTFDPPVVTFTLNPDDEAGGSQLVVLNAYNATYDPDNCDSSAPEIEENGCGYGDDGHPILLPEEEWTDDLEFQWFDEDGDSLSSTLQSLTQGQTNFILRATDSYGDFSEDILPVIIYEPNTVPTAITFELDSLVESTANLDEYEETDLDTLLLIGNADDENIEELGVLWSMLSDNLNITMLNDSSLIGSFFSGEILHNDYPDTVDFALTVWDAFSCYPSNSVVYDSETDEWDISCPEGEDSTTFGVDTLILIIKNYNSAPTFFDEFSVVDDLYPELEINEDDTTIISFDYNFWADNNFFSDVDDCDFDIITNSCTGYSASSFTVNMLEEGEHFNTVIDSLFLESNFFGSIVVPFQINDNNAINNSSELDTLYITINSVNDIPEILSFENDELIDEGVQEDIPFEILLDDMTYYDVEGDTDANGSCDEGECTGITLGTVVDPDYTLAPSGMVIPTQNFFGTLHLGIQISDGDSQSDFFYVDIPIHGTNDPPSVIEGASPDTLLEDFGVLSFDLYNIFTDVDGDALTFDKVDESFVCVIEDAVNDSFLNQEECEANDGGAWISIFNSEIEEGSEFLDITSVDHLFGEHSVTFSVSDPESSTISETVSFYVSPVNDPPVGIDSLFLTPTNTDSTETIDLTIVLEATDVDSDSVSFSVEVGQLENGIFPNGNIPIQTGPFTAEIDYRPNDDYRCEELFQFYAHDYTENWGSCVDDLCVGGDFEGDDCSSENGDLDCQILSISDSASIRIEVGACNFPPEVTVNLSIGLPEDQNMSFINDLGIGWCWDSYNEEWSQDSSSTCGGDWQESKPEYFYSLNDDGPNGFETFDADSGDVVYLEIHEGDNYYLESGYCAAPDPGVTDWFINLEEPCGLVSQEEDCAGDVQESAYNDLPVYCGCLDFDICTASQLHMEELGNKIVVRPEKDYEEDFDITIVGYDDEYLYNLSEEQFIPVNIAPSNDPPILSSIEDQDILEDESLTLKYIYVDDLADLASYDSDTTFTIYDSDNIENELLFSSYPSNIYSQSWNKEDSTITITPNANWNGEIEVRITFQDIEWNDDGDDIMDADEIVVLSEAFVVFDLYVEGVPDDNEYTSVSTADGEDAIIIMEDDYDIDDPVVHIHFTDIDYNDLYPEDPVGFRWQVSPLYGEDSNVIFNSNFNYDVGLDENGEWYYIQQITLLYLGENWNGEDGIILTDTTAQLDIVLDVIVKQSNDVPEIFYLYGNSINNYNVIDINWSSGLGIEEEEWEDICIDPTLAQGTYTDGSCSISNFYIRDREQWKIVEDSQIECNEENFGLTFDNEEECENVCEGITCTPADALYYRLPFSATPGVDAPSADSLLFKWYQTTDIDMDPSIGNEYNDMDILYRIELIDKTNNRVLVLQDSIPKSLFTGAQTPEMMISLDDAYFSYEYQSEKDCDQNCLDSPVATIELCCNDYYDRCIHTDLTIADTSTFSIDLTGNIMYQWRVSANNDWCDFEGDNPSRSSATDIGVVDSFYLDITPPYASISILQNEIAPEFMKLYISFDEPIEAWRSGIFVIDDGGSTQSKNFPEENAENIYTITELFPSTGLVTIEIESWDKVGNGIISRKQAVYEEVPFNTFTSIQSPSGTLLMQFDENDLDKTSTILIQEEGEYDEIVLRSDLQRVSPIYSINSVDMHIIGEVDVEILIPEYLSDIEYWKFRIQSIEYDVPVDDITTWSKDGKVYGTLKALESVALYYDSSAEYEIPEGIDLVGNYPNPFNPTTTIYYFVSEDNSDIRLSILDLLGREVRVLLDGTSDIGYYEIKWDGTNNSGIELGSGIYFISARVSGKQHYKKLMKLK